MHSPRHLALGVFFSFSLAVAGDGAVGGQGRGPRRQERQDTAQYGAAGGGGHAQHGRGTQQHADEQQARHL